MYSSRHITPRLHAAAAVHALELTAFLRRAAWLLFGLALCNQANGSSTVVSYASELLERAAQMHVAKRPALQCSGAPFWA